MEVITYILKDLGKPIAILPGAMLAGAGVLLLLILLRSIRIGEFSLKCLTEKKNLQIWIFASYLFVVADTVYFSREPGSYVGINLGFLDTWSESPIARAYVIENILLLIPFGILLPELCPFFRSVLRCVGMGFLLRLLTEMVQLATGRGYCQLDDLWTNVAGVWMGYAGAWIVRQKRKKKNTNQ